MKKSPFIKCALLLVGVLEMSGLRAQEFSISGEFKPRFEYRHGYGKLRPLNDSLDRAASFITQRSRLNVNYSDVKQHFRLGAILQDVRNWGSTEQLNIGDKNTFGIHEFWGELLLSDQFSLKLGRQELNYDNARVVGNSDWSQQARSFDAAVLKYELPQAKLKFNAVAGFNSKSETLTQEVYDVNNYKYLQLLWMNKKFSNLNASVLFLNNGVEYTVNKSLAVTAANRKVAFSQTIGSRLEYSKTKLGANLEGYYQGGHDASNRTLRAWDATAELVLKPVTAFTAIAGAEILSGTATNETDGRNHSFSPFYGTNHKLNGTMDYFFVGGRFANSTGLQDYYLSLKYKTDKFSMDLTPHMFYSKAKVVSDGSALNRFLAFETDISAGYKLSEIAAIQGGFSFLKGSSTLQFLIPDGDKSKFNSWAWTQLVIKPKFFSVAK